LYGPLLAVLLLPLTLLWSTETSRHGCTPTSQLYNAMIVTWFLWLILSAGYRILAMILAPNILYKHCLCVVGYSFVAWNLALLLSLAMEQSIHNASNLDNSVVAFSFLPLVILGLPASIAQVRNSNFIWILWYD
jgi:hypothetical protein